jgi:hypothetical protein
MIGLVVALGDVLSEWRIRSENKTAAGWWRRLLKRGRRSNTAMMLMSQDRK